MVILERRRLGADTKCPFGSLRSHGHRVTPVSFANCARSKQPVDLIDRKGLGIKIRRQSSRAFFAPLVVGVVVTTLSGIVYSKSRSGAQPIWVL